MLEVGLRRDPAVIRLLLSAQCGTVKHSWSYPPLPDQGTRTRKGPSADRPAAASKDRGLPAVARLAEDSLLHGLAASGF